MNQGTQFQMTMPLTPMVKKIIIVTVAVWIIGQIILEKMVGFPLTSYFGLTPLKVIQGPFVWQPLTYLFLHSSSVFHIVFNMLILWWIGADLELRWGSKFFLIYYLVSGVGAGIIYTLCIWIYALVTGQVLGLVVPVVGASGAVFGVMLAFGLLFGERVIYFMALFPMKARVFILILVGIELLTLFNSGVVGSGVANLAHLGGFISGFLFLVGWTKYQQRNWKKKNNKRGRRLKLVVDNDSGSDSPKYWN